MTYNNSILNLKDFNQPCLWDLAERYLYTRGGAYRIVKIEANQFSLKKDVGRKISWTTVLKVISYFTLILPLIAVALKFYYRKQYSFEVGTEAPSHTKSITEKDSVAQPSASTPVVQSNPRGENNRTRNDEVIQKVREAKARGEKVALFIGKTNAEALPKESGWTWFSLDRAVDRTKDRHHHFEMDFITLGLTPLINALFNKVVVDYSVLKFFVRPVIQVKPTSVWKILHKLLDPDPTSELIVESASSLVSAEQQTKFDPEWATMSIRVYLYTEEIKQKIEIFNKWITNVTFSKALERYRSYCRTRCDNTLTNPTEAELRAGRDQSVLDFMYKILQEEGISPPNFKIPLLQDLLERIRGLLKELFEQVELHNGSYPYRTENAQFWVLRSPKPLIAPQTSLHT